MPSIKTARAQKRKASVNKRAMSYQRSRVAVARSSIATDASAPETLTALHIAIKALDQSASKGIIHKRTAARSKSRLMRAYNAQAASAS